MSLLHHYYRVYFEGITLSTISNFRGLAPFGAYMHAIFTVALKYTLSRFEVVGDSTELSLIQLRSARFNWAQLDPS